MFTSVRRTSVELWEAYNNSLSQSVTRKNKHFSGTYIDGVQSPQTLSLQPISWVLALQTFYSMLDVVLRSCLSVGNMVQSFAFYFNFARLKNKRLHVVQSPTMWIVSKQGSTILAQNHISDSTGLNGHLLSSECGGQAMFIVIIQQCARPKRSKSAGLKRQFALYSN